MSTLLAELSRAFVETGEWRPLHDALLEAGYEALAWHARHLEGCNNSRQSRTSCDLSRIMDDNEFMRDRENYWRYMMEKEGHHAPGGAA